MRNPIDRSLRLAGLFYRGVLTFAIPAALTLPTGLLAVDFAPRADYATGVNARAVAVFDLDADGDADIVIANRASVSMSVFLNNGDGTFSARADYAAGTTPHSALIADLNGDGRPDIVIANRDDDTLSVFFNRGGGLFSPGVLVATGDGPRSVDAADFDKDGDLDLVVANTFDHTVTFHRNRGNGTFDPPVSYPVGLEPTFLALADFDKDGFIDFAVTCATTNVMTVMRNAGNGVFAARADYPVGLVPRGAAAADLDGDGYPDLVAANVSGRSVSILRNLRNGTFEAAGQLATGGESWGVGAADMDGDGRAELVTSNQSNGTLSYFTNLGGFQFSTRIDYQSGNGATAIVLADVNGDGRRDMVSANWFANSMSVFLQNAAPTARITSPSGSPSVEAATPVSFAGAGSDPEGDALSYSWDFGDGRTAATKDVEHAYALPGTYRAVLTVRDSKGGTGTASTNVTVTEPVITGPAARILIPVVVETAGVGGSRYSTEVTLASLANAATTVLLYYTPTRGGGPGYARLTLQPGEQRLIPNIVSFLRAQGAAIATDDTGKVGTLVATFLGVDRPSRVFAGARTFTLDPAGSGGTFGLFSPGIPVPGPEGLPYQATLFADSENPRTPAAPSANRAWVYGLQQNASQRSNLALVNAGKEAVTLRVSLFGPAGENLGTLPDVALEGYGWFQFGQPLAGKAASGRALVTRVSGTSPFTAYGVLNDTQTSDGSFVAPLDDRLRPPPPQAAANRMLPVVLDVRGLGSRFRTELTLANLRDAPLSLTLRYTAATGFGGGTGDVSVTLAAGEQRVLPDAIAYLRGAGLAIENDGRDVAGSLLFTAPAGFPVDAFAAGARVFAVRAQGGTFGLFYGASTPDESADEAAFVFGLQQGDGRRSNLAVVNRGGGAGAGAITLRITYFASDGTPLGEPVTRTLAAGEWVQFSQPLRLLGASAGYARIVKTSGSSSFIAYAALNDAITSDGSYIPFQVDDPRP